MAATLQDGFAGSTTLGSHQADTGQAWNVPSSGITLQVSGGKLFEAGASTAGLYAPTIQSGRFNLDLTVKARRSPYGPFSGTLGTIPYGGSPYITPITDAPLIPGTITINIPIDDGSGGNPGTAVFTDDGAGGLHSVDIGTPGSINYATGSILGPGGAPTIPGTGYSDGRQTSAIQGPVTGSYVGYGFNKAGGIIVRAINETGLLDNFIGTYTLIQWNPSGLDNVTLNSILVAWTMDTWKRIRVIISNTRMCIYVADEDGSNEVQIGNAVLVSAGDSGHTYVGLLFSNTYGALYDDLIVKPLTITASLDDSSFTDNGLVLAPNPAVLSFDSVPSGFEIDITDTSGSFDDGDAAWFTVESPPGPPV
jgi:hypothetical protein